MSYNEMGHYKIHHVTGELIHEPCGENFGPMDDLGEAYGTYRAHQYACDVQRGLIVPQGTPANAGPV